MAEIIPLKINMSSDDVVKLIRELCEDTSNVILTDHAKERMVKRKITFPHILSCLKLGRVTEGPYKSTQGDWKCNLTRAIAGIDITSTVAVDLEQKIIIITVF